MLAEHREIYNDNTLTDEVNRMCLADTRLFLPGLNLAYTDRSSMAASTEVRTPFVDPVVVRAAFAIPGRQKIRRAAGQGGAEEGRGDLAAQGDHAPARRPRSAPRCGPGSAATSRDWSHDVAGPRRAGGQRVSCGRAPLHRLVADDQAGREDRSKQIWQLLTLELLVPERAVQGVSA